MLNNYKTIHVITRQTGPPEYVCIGAAVCVCVWRAVLSGEGQEVSARIEYGQTYRVSEFLEEI